MVVIGVGEGETIGDMVGTGCALAAIVVAPAMNAPARTMPANHRFMKLSSFGECECLSASYPRLPPLNWASVGSQLSKARNANQRQPGG